MRRSSTRVLSFIAALLLAASAEDVSAQPIGGTLETPVAFLVSSNLGTTGASESGRVGVKLDVGGIPGLCHPLTQTCGQLSPAELVFSEQVLVGGLARVEIWSLADVPLHLLMRHDGTPCSAEDECTFGVGYLLLLLNAAGQPLAGHAELGLEAHDDRFERARVFLAPGGSTSLLWIETSSSCAGECFVFSWSEIRLRAEPGHQPLTVRSGPFSTGITDVDLVENPDGTVAMCTMIRRGEPTYDPSTGRLSLVRSVELVGESGQTQTLTYAADGMIVSSEEAPSTPTEIPLTSQVCEAVVEPE